MAAELKSQNNSPVRWPDGTEVEILNGREVRENDAHSNKEKLLLNEFVNNNILNQNIDTSTFMNESTTDPEATSDHSMNENSSNSSNVVFGTICNGHVEVKHWIHERTLNANQNFSDIPDTVQIIGKDQITGDKKLSFNILLQRRALATIVLVITVVFIITAACIGGYYFHLYGRVKTAGDKLDETTRHTFEAATTKDAFDETTGNTSEATTTNTHTAGDAFDETTGNTFEATTTDTLTTEDETHVIAIAEPAEPDAYKYITRSEYKASPPTETLTPLSTPIKRVIIGHTAGDNANCSDIDSCSSRVLGIQRVHMVSKKYSDIGLNFLVGGDGNVYEGRGYYQGAHTCKYNEGSICISLIGNFEEYAAPERQLEAAKSFIRNLKKENKIDPNYELFCQIQLNGASSPGRYVYDLVQSWPQWVNKTMQRYTCP